jgi:hypothetical protein
MKRVPRNVVTVNGSILFIFLVAEENLERTVTGRQINVPAAQTVTHFFGLISIFFSLLWMEMMTKKWKGFPLQR